MEFTINRDVFLKSLGHANGIIEKKTTLPILSNILIEAKESKIKITATDLDIIYFEEITLQEVKKEYETVSDKNVYLWEKSLKLGSVSLDFRGDSEVSTTDMPQQVYQIIRDYLHVVKELDPTVKTVSRATLRRG